MGQSARQFYRTRLCDLVAGSAKVKRGVNRIPVRKKELFFYLKLLLIKKHFRDAEIYKIYHVCPDIGLPAASGVARCHATVIQSRYQRPHPTPRGEL